MRPMADMERRIGELNRKIEQNTSATRNLPQFGELDLSIDQLELTGRGSWVAQLDTGATVELGRGTEAEVNARSTRFLRTLTQVTARYSRRPDAMESADLRHPEGYALRLRGVSTVVNSEPKK